MLTKFGYLYPEHVWIDSSRVGGGNIGYVSFNIFLDPARLMNLFGEAVQSCMKCDGFVIDLRGNPGGIGAMAMGMAGWFIDQSNQRLGTLYMRDTTLKFVINPRVNTFSGPLAILVDGSSASTSEILAGGIEDRWQCRGAVCVPKIRARPRSFIPPARISDVEADEPSTRIASGPENVFTRGFITNLSVVIAHVKRAEPLIRLIDKPSRHAHGHRSDAARITAQIDSRSHRNFMHD